MTGRMQFYWIGWMDPPPDMRQGGRILDLGIKRIISQDETEGAFYRLSDEFMIRVTGGFYD